MMHDDDDDPEAVATRLGLPPMEQFLEMSEESMTFALGFALEKMREDMEKDMACLVSLRRKLGPAEFDRRLEDLGDPEFDVIRDIVASIEHWRATGLPPRPEG
jgi:hypothetical protein